MNKKLFNATSDEKLNLIKKRLYQSTSINNLGDSVYDYTAINDITYLLEQILELQSKNATFRGMIDNGLGWKDMENNCL